MWDLMYDKLGDLLVLASLAGFATVWKHSRDVDRKHTKLELKLAEHYVTKPELKVVEGKIDHLSDIMTTKIDRINDNLLLLLRTPHA